VEMAMKYGEVAKKMGGSMEFQKGEVKEIMK